jgi:hypothetical protein
VSKSKPPIEVFVLLNADDALVADPFRDMGDAVEAKDERQAAGREGEHISRAELVFYVNPHMT